MRRILLLGPPRSGSTWVSEILAAVPGSHRVHEPDSDPHEPYALIAKAGLGRYPRLDPGATARRYDTLWTAAFTPSQRRHAIVDAPARAVLRSTSLATRNAVLFQTPSRRARVVERALRLTARPVSPPPADLHIIKSVHSPMSAGFVAARTDAQVVVIRRNPLNAVASWLELDWLPQHLGADAEQEQRIGAALGAPPPPATAPLEVRQAWSYTALTRALDIEAARHPDWLVVQHEDLCNDPTGGFRSMFERLDLAFGPEVQASLTENDRPESGYVTRRVASEQAERWKTRLSDVQVDRIRSTAESLSIDC